MSNPYKLSNSEKKCAYYVLDNHVIAVAAEGYADDWAAYIGQMAGDSLDTDVHSVRRTGRKLPYEVAIILFPQFKDLKWRD